MFCHKCGTQLHADAEFCHKCGRPVPPDQDSSPVATQIEIGISPKPTENLKTTTAVEASQVAVSIFALLYIAGGILVFALGMHSAMQGERVSLWFVLISQGLLFLAAGFAILFKKKSATTLVWVTVILGGIGTIARGLVPLDILGEIATVIFALWFQRISQALPQEKTTQSGISSDEFRRSEIISAFLLFIVLLVILHMFR